MPGGDRTGPVGLGPMTGRGAGFCAGYATPGYMNAGPGMGRGFGGGGRGRRNRFWATGVPGWAVAQQAPVAAPVSQAAPVPVDEVTVLRQEAAALRDRLEAITQRLESLEKTE